MRRLIPAFFSVFFIFAAIAETTHNHKQTCDAPCPVVCLGGSCASYCGNPDPRQSLPPLELSRPAARSFEAAFIRQLSEDEIFHPPVV